MHLNITIDDRLLPEASRSNVERYITESLCIRGYLMHTLSIGEIKEILDLPSIGATRDWLCAHGLATIQMMPEALEVAEEEHYQLVKGLGV